jgi:hypothetical protein
MSTIPTTPPEPQPEQPTIPVNALPGVEDKVREFLMSKGAQVEAPTEKPATVERAKVDPDPIFSEPNPEEQAVQSALIDLRAVKITEEDKDLFMKALLCDAPFVLTVPLFGGQVKLTFRSRTMYEQRRVLDTLHLDQKTGIVADNDPALVFTRLQQYFASLMMKSFNDEPFSDLVLKPGRTAEEDATELRKVFTDKFEGGGHIRWTTILNGLRIFEEKCRQLSEQCANEDFWKPQG